MIKHIVAGTTGAYEKELKKLRLAFENGKVPHNARNRYILQPVPHSENPAA